MRWALRAGVLLLAAATWLFTPMTARSVALPDLTATKSDDVGGATTLNTSWTWTIRIANVGGASADFPDGSAIFIDEPPNDFRLTYGEFKVVSASGVTGSVLCGPTSSGPLECFADHGPVSITAGGFLDVAFLAAPTAPYLFGSFTNPRGGGGRCGVDRQRLDVDRARRQ